MIRLLRGCSIAALVLAAALFATAEIRQRMNADDTLPVITADSDDLVVPCDYTEDQLLAGVTASDAVDGDLTNQILVGNFTRFITPGNCDLSYVVFDSSNHMATLTRHVHFTNYHSPRFSLTSPLMFAENSTTHSDVLKLFGASDLLDGDLSDWVTYVDTDATYSNPGDYTITMEVCNSFGDTVSYAFPIHIYERGTQDFTISLTEPLVYVNQGDSFDPLSYVDSVMLGNTSYPSSLLNITSTVDPSKPGLYEVHYELGGSSGTSGEENGESDNESASSEEADSNTSSLPSSLYGQAWLTVIVQEVQS